MICQGISVHLTKYLRSLGLRGVREVSIKFTPLSVDCARYVIGVPADSLSRKEWHSILRYFNPPYSMASEMDALIGESTTLLLGQDGDWENGNRRIYIENWNAVYQFMESTRGSLSGARNDLQFKTINVMHGWKWSRSCTSKPRRSDYYVFPLLQMDQSLEIFKDQVCMELVDRRFELSFANLWSILRQRSSLDRAVQLWQTVDISIDGSDTSRRSFDLNLIDFNLESQFLGLFMSSLHSFCPESMDTIKMFMPELCDGQISHISAGRTYEDIPFISFYFLIS